MRVLVVLLLLANIAWFAWSRWVQPSGAEPPAPRAVEPPLLLDREAPRTAAAAPPRPRVAGNCVSLGPFTDLTDAARASTLLRENGLQPRQRAGQGVVWKGYWVSLDGVPDEPTAEGVLERLRRFGIGDAYTVPAEGEGITISLGLFSDRQRALRRADDVKALGLEPRLSERDRSGTLYWIDVNVEPPAQLPDPSALEGGEGRILRLEIAPCEAAARESRPVPEVATGRALPG